MWRLFPERKPRVITECLILLIDMLHLQLRGLGWTRKTVCYTFIRELVFAHYSSDVDHEQLNNSEPPIPAFCPHDDSCNNCWVGYPQSRFPNWTYKQIVKSKIRDAITSYDKDKPCTLHCIDVDSNGLFMGAKPIKAVFGKESKVWRELINEEVNIFQCGSTSPFDGL